jgi:hypothetical protein
VVDEVEAPICLPVRRPVCKSVVAPVLALESREKTALSRDDPSQPVKFEFLGGTHFALDGVKLPSNAAKEFRVEPAVAQPAAG